MLRSSSRESKDLEREMEMERGRFQEKGGSRRSTQGKESSTKGGWSSYTRLGCKGSWEQLLLHVCEQGTHPGRGMALAKSGNAAGQGSVLSRDRQHRDLGEFVRLEQKLTGEEMKESLDLNP